jgi:hypothetical protein
MLVESGTGTVEAHRLADRDRVSGVTTTNASAASIREANDRVSGAGRAWWRSVRMLLDTVSSHKGESPR